MSSLSLTFNGLDITFGTYVYLDVQQLVEKVVSSLPPLLSSSSPPPSSSPPLSQPPPQVFVAGASNPPPLASLPLPLSSPLDTRWVDLRV
ncbi:hypothetical protein V1477_009545 [Vespula maculifrons]|uniref:Uncharacterized protein n=1 Tax=Vespula maculifrons TaxID=7453 RepID=A0ABD2CA42_VESMC